MNDPKVTPDHPLQPVPEYKFSVLLAARGNPDYRQDPNRPPHGVYADTVVGRETAEEAHHLVARFISGFDLGSGNWVGGDLWEDDEHAGCFAYNGRFVSGEYGPLLHNNSLCTEKRA